MSDDTGGSGGGPASPTIDDQTARKVGEQILDILRSARLAPTPAGGPFTASSDIGRMVYAFLHIDDPRVRSEFVSLVEAIGGTAR